MNTVMLEQACQCGWVVVTVYTLIRSRATEPSRARFHPTSIEQCFSHSIRDVQ